MKKMHKLLKMVLIILVFFDVRFAFCGDLPLNLPVGHEEAPIPIVANGLICTISDDSGKVIMTINNVLKETRSWVSYEDNSFETTIYWIPATGATITYNGLKGNPEGLPPLNYVEHYFDGNVFITKRGTTSMRPVRNSPDELDLWLAPYYRRHEENFNGECMYFIEYLNTVTVFAIYDDSLDGDITLTVDSTTVTKGSRILENPPIPPRIIDGRTMLPFRYLVQTVLGGKVDYDAASRMITAVISGHEITMVVDQLQIIVDGQAYECEQSPVIVEGHTLVPLRAFEQIISELKWDELTQTVTIVP